MKDEFQNIAIAEFCDPDKYKPGTGVVINGEPIWITGDGNPITCPRFTRSSDAMREALAKLPDDDWDIYWDNLCELTRALKANDWGRPYTDSKLLLLAEPGDQAQALLESLDLWI